MATLVYKRSNPRALSAELGLKLLGFILALTVVMGLLLCGIGEAFAAPFPRNNVVVTGEKIRLGDVFEDVHQNADFVLAPAPKPGEELVWNGATLLRIATAFNLPWRPDAADQVRIRRDATLIDSETLRAVLRDHLASANDGLFEVTLTGDIPQIIMPANASPQMDVVDFNMQSRGGNFSAILRASSGDGFDQNITVYGTARKMVTMPMLKNPVRPGTIITAQDIAWQPMPETDVRKDMLSTETDLVGSTPRRPLMANAAVKAVDLEKPKLIKRGEMVTMVFRNGAMMLTAKGRSLTDGSLGDVIKVTNVGSNRQIEARVTAEKEVTVN